MLDHYDMYLLSLCLRKERCDKKRTAWKFVFLSAGVSTFAELGAHLPCSSPLHRVSSWQDGAEQLVALCGFSHHLCLLCQTVATSSRSLFSVLDI